MTELKTKPGRASVTDFLSSIDDRQKRADCRAISKMMREATGNRARMWGSSIVGFGSYDYRYASGHSGTWPICGFSPRKRNLVLYIMPGFSEFLRLMSKLGQYRTGKSCLYLKRLDDVDEKILRSLIVGSVRFMKKKYNIS